MNNKRDCRLLSIRGLIASGLLLANLPVYADQCQQARQLFEQFDQQSNLTKQYQDLQTIVRLCPNAVGLIALGDTAKQLGLLVAAQNYFVQAMDFVDDQPDDLKGLLFALKSEVYTSQNNLCDAQNALMLAHKFAPTHPVVKRAQSQWDDVRSQQVLSAKTINCLMLAADRAFNRGMVLVPSFDLTVQFDTNRSDINPKGVQQLMALGEALSHAHYHKYHFIMIGHADSRGEVSYNQRLSQLRANEVRGYLEKYFPVIQGRIRALGKGESELKVLDNSDKAHRINRRVEVQLVMIKS